MPKLKPSFVPDAEGDPIESKKSVPIDEAKLKDVVEINLDATGDEVSEVAIQVVSDVPKADRNRKVGSDPAYNPADVAELENVSEKTQQRFKKLSFEFNNERRRADAAERKFTEAVDYAKTVQAQNEALQTTRTETDTALASSMVQRHEGLIEQAKAKLAKSHDDGDSAAIVDAQEELARYSAELVQIRVAQPKAADPRPQTPNPQPIAPEAPSGAPAAPPRPVDPKLDAWVERNSKWFYKDGYEQVTGYAMGLDQSLKREGIDPGSDQYYDRIDAGLRETFPGVFAEENAQVDDTTVTPRGAPVTAPSDTPAQGPRKKPRTVRLTGSMLDIASELGITPQQYAAQRAKQQQEESQ